MRLPSTKAVAVVIGVREEAVVIMVAGEGGMVPHSLEQEEEVLLM